MAHIGEGIKARPSPEYKFGKRNLLSNTGNFFCFNSSVSNLYNNDVIIYKIKKNCENSFFCEQVYLIFLLQHWSNS